MISIVVEELLSQIRNSTQLRCEVKKCTKPQRGYQFIRIAFFNDSESNAVIERLDLVAEGVEYALESQESKKFVLGQGKSVLKEYPFSVKPKDFVICEFCINVTGKPIICSGEYYLVYYVRSGKTKGKINIP